MSRSVVLLCLAAAAFLAMFFASRDDAPPQDADLRPAPVVVADADNAWFDFQRLAVALDLTPEDRDFLAKQADGGLTDRPRVETLLARNAEALKLFASFARRPAFLDPSFRDPAAVGPETPSPELLPIVAAARLTSLRAELLLKDGKPDAALDEALLVYDAGRLLARSHAQLIECLIGPFVMDLGSETVREAIRSGTLDRTRRLEAAKRLSAPTGATAGLQDSLRYEYMSLSYAVTHLAEFAAKSHPGQALHNPLITRGSGYGYIYMPNRTRAMFARRYRELVAQAAKPCLVASLPTHATSRFSVAPNVAGRIFYETSVPDYSSLFTRRCATDFRAARAGIEAAEFAHRKDLGRVPTSLSVLAPRYLDAIPSDPFSGAELKYDRDTGLVESVGRDADGDPL